MAEAGPRFLSSPVPQFLYSVPVDLDILGWRPAHAAAFAEFAAAGLVPGRVALEHNHVFRVLTEAGEVLAETAGRVKHRATERSELPTVGDWVAVRPDPAGGRALIAAVMPRSTSFTRKVAGRETEAQVIAANIDTVFVVFGLDAGLNSRAIERYVLVARLSGAAPVVVLNKVDLLEDEENPAEVRAAVEAEAAAAAGDVPVLLLTTRDDSARRALAPWLSAGRTVALLGPSGAGKSSLINALIGEARLATGEVRETDARGRHTSVHRELVVLPTGGLLIDTPGMRELQMWDSAAGLGDAFEDIAAIAPECRFRDCRHDQEPGCAVKAAVESGRLDAGRYLSYLKLQEERDTLAKRLDERAILDTKRHSRIANKALKALQKHRDR